uniref:EGF-like domain-containing protein n=1 Tax=Panagrolaimus sp. ES5 TaxID=591445 RepID=A0AC34GG85_9BILA
MTVADEAPPVVSVEPTVLAQEVPVVPPIPSAIALTPETITTTTRLPAVSATSKGISEPVCKNNGTFVVTGPNSFICNCPENTVGVDCGTLLTCEPGACGANATCTIFNHKKVCTCPP